MASLIRRWHPTGSYSSRGGSGVRLVVLHTSAGAHPNSNLGPFIQGNNGVSYHVSFDNVTGGQAAPECYEYVTRGNKAWANCDHNAHAITGCFCTDAAGGSGWSRSQWLAQDRALWNAAKWVREECDYFGIPLVELTPSQAQGGGRGICQHMDLGGSGCGHADCGNGFPMDELIKRAKGGAGSAAPEPKPPFNVGAREDDLMGMMTGGTATVSVVNDVGHIRLTADPGWEGVDSIAIRVAIHKANTPNWPVTNVTLTPAAPRRDVPLHDGGTGDCVKLSVTGDHEVGYALL